MKRILLALASALALTASVEASEYVHPKLTAGTLRIRRIAVLPAKIDVQRSGARGGESMIAESEAIADAVGALISKLFSSLGFTIVEDPMRTAVDQSADERRTAIGSLQSRFDAFAPQIMSNPKDVTKGRFSLGDDVGELLSDAADAVVFVRGSGFVATTGKRLLTAAMGVSAPKGMLSCDVIVMDARSGDILFLASTTRVGDFVKQNGRQLEKPLAKSLKKMPVGS